MNDALDRLRAADPAVTAHDTGPRSPHARSLLERVLTDAPAPSRRGRRRLAIGLAGATVAAAAAAFFIVDPAAAYTVDKHADGSVVFSFRADRLNNPAKLNADLARAGARTVVIRMVPADRCTAPLDMDPVFPFRNDLTQEQLDRYPVSYRPVTNGVVITIQPEKMPAGDTLAFGYAIRDDRDGQTTFVKPAVVRTLPSCMAIPTPRER
jgi:hypothetical protein